MTLKFDMINPHDEIFVENNICFHLLRPLLDLPALTNLVNIGTCSEW